MKYNPYESEWQQPEWKDYCPTMTFRVVGQDELPGFLPPTLTQKFNSAIVASSGNENVDTFLVQGFRIDGSAIDEHQYIATFDKRNGKVYAGFIEHADYENRTTNMPAEMEELIALSGIDVPVQFPRKPDQPTGTLGYLQDQNLIQGFETAIKKQSNSENIEF
ncbi:MAG: hypothetical protein MI807_10075 [Verrucomicrobiales bacterium]|nr:hypothetical protein [Verrucomicrobiales bacterium]